MLDLRALVYETEIVASKLSRRNVPIEEVEKAAESIVIKNSLKKDLESLQSISRELREALVALNSSQSSTGLSQPLSVENREILRACKKELVLRRERYREAALEADRRLRALPNIPDAESLETDETTIVQTWGGDADFCADGVPFHKLGARLGLIDSVRAEKIGGPGFLVFLDEGAKFLRSIESFGVEAQKGNYREVVLPQLVQERVLHASGHLPKFHNDAYKLAEDSLWAVPTSEASLVGLHAQENIDGAKLPFCYMAQTSCFRKEVGKSGKNAHWRLHEYKQIELVRLCRPDQGETSYKQLLQDSVKALQLLEVAYRVKKLSPTDLPFAASRGHQVEVYSPGTDIWIPVSTAALFSDFQARRSDIRFRDGRKSGFVVTMGSSALAVTRMWGVLLEQGLQKDGRVRIPKVLQPYMGREYLG